MAEQFDDVDNISNAPLLVGEIKEATLPYIVLFFTYLTEENVSMQADITDNFVETNYAIQDHIALKPRTIKLRGLVGEISFKKPAEVGTFLATQLAIAQSYTLQQTLLSCQPLESLVPTLSSYTRTAIGVYEQVKSSIKRYQNIFKNFKGTQYQASTPTAQQQQQYIIQKKMLEDITYLFNNRVAVNLSGFAFEDQNNSIANSLWHIQSVNVTQGESQYISDVEIILKEIRIAETQYKKLDSSKFASPRKQEPPNGGDRKPTAPAGPKWKDTLKKTGNNVAKIFSSITQKAQSLGKFAGMFERIE